jgi:hypothetical protein
MRSQNTQQQLKQATDQLQQAEAQVSALRAQVAQQNADASRPGASRTDNAPRVTSVDGPAGATRIITFPDDPRGLRTITIGPNGVPMQNLPSSAGRPTRDIPPGVSALMNDGIVAVVMIVATVSIARIIGRMLDRRAAAPRADSDTAQRLQAIENAVESIAVEVERISEGQRFTARVLTERTQQPAPELIGNGMREKVERANG